MSPDYEAVRALIAVRDEKRISDEARRWADDEIELPGSPDLTRNPSTRGAWRASLEIAFDAGRLMGQREGRPT